MKNRPAKNLSQLEINQSPSTKMIKYKADSFLNTQCFMILHQLPNNYKTINKKN